MALIESHLVSVTVDPIKVHDDGKLKKTGNIEDGNVEWERDFHYFHQEEDSPEVHVTQDSPEQEAGAEDEAWEVEAEVEEDVEVRGDQSSPRWYGPYVLGGYCWGKERPHRDLLWLS